MNKWILVLIFGLMFSGMVSGASVDDEILKKFDEGANMVRVLMKTSDNINIPRDSGVYGFKAQKVESAIDEVRVNKKVGDYISAYISRDDLERLKVSGEVESIDVEKTYYTMLQDSVGIMNFSPTWNLEANGLNLTGIGQSVCVIDTGINYSHSDFGGCTTAEFIAGNCTKVIGGWDFCGNDGDCSIEDNDPMDVGGHGTHVSGIVAANGGIKGTAQGTNIVMMKASNASGVFYSVNIIAAIDRCIANASVFNISVISMSLGGGQYDSYCDGADTGITNSINNAVANGISVVVATGNTGGDLTNATAGISNPACIENATRVSASTKSPELYAIYAFRHSFFKDILMATGGSSSDINSTVIGGGYGGKMGTSMATPMVAGAIAIINQYLSLSGQTKTPSEISDILNDTGVVLDDSTGSGYNFSRINVYSALLSLDIDAPNVSLVSPVDNHINLSVNQTFNCNATDWQLMNVTFKIWNSTDLYYNETKNLTGVSNESNFSLTDMPFENYNWNCLVFDNRSNSAFASANYSLTIGGLDIVLDSPANATYTNLNDTNFTCNSSSDSNYELSNVTFYLWNSSGLVYNLTEDIGGFDNSTVFNYTFSEEDNYSWNCLAVNNGSNESWGDSNFSLTYDVTFPVISSVASSVSSSGATVTWTTNEDANSSISVGGGSWSNSSDYWTSHSIVVSGLSASTAYNYNVTSCDRAGNCNSSSSSFATSAAASTGSPGGSSTSSLSSSSTGGATPAGPRTYKASSSDVLKGYTQTFKKDEKVNFSLFDFKGERHLLTVNEVGVDYVNVTVESEPINFILGIGQSVKLNLTSVDYYDLLVELKSIVNGSAELKIQLISEPIEKVVVEEKIVEIENLVVKDYIGIVIFLLVVLVLIVFVVIMANRSAREVPSSGKELKGGKTNKKDGRKSKKTEA